MSDLYDQEPYMKINGHWQETEMTERHIVGVLVPLTHVGEDGMIESLWRSKATYEIVIEEMDFNPGTGKFDIVTNEGDFNNLPPQVRQTAETMYPGINLDDYKFFWRFFVKDSFGNCYAEKPQSALN